MSANDNAKREHISPDMTRALGFHLRLTGDYIASLTVEKRKSAYPNAKLDYLIFDKDGTAVIEGRQFGGGAVSYWRRVAQLPTS